ncbi:lysozyme inhibitor LprI family protein [Roseibacillus persicicus]|uniref:lysozyme inhibitor LprI family protein n=1 Tax=Roseibacillus persicicus TaxID=454148 RepID=UPI00398AA189
MTFRILFSSLFLMAGSVSAQNAVNGNEQAASSAEAERKIMETTFDEILTIVGKESERGKMFRRAQNEWIKYVKEQAQADADGVSGEAKYPQSYFQTMRELTRYRTRVLEGCLQRLQAEKIGVRGDVASSTESAFSSGNSSARDWKNEVGDEPSAETVALYEAEIEGVSGVLGGQWRGEELWRGVFLADRGDSIVLYGGKMERGGVVFEAWQEGTRIGRGFVRDEDGDLRGRFFDERRRESPIVLKLRKQPNPVSYDVALTRYTGLLDTEELEIGLEWHDTRFVRGKMGERILTGHNYSQGKLFLVETDAAEGGNALAVWSLEKKSAGGGTRWTGTRKTLDDSIQKVDFGR